MSVDGGSILTSWQLISKIVSRDVNSLAASMHGEVECTLNGDSLSFTLLENAANDMRAMWNTRMRSIVSVESVLEMVKNSIPEGQTLNDGE